MQWLTGDANAFVLDNSTGSIVTATHTSNLTGTARITVTFEGQNVSDSVVIRVTNFRSIEVVARPEPAYSGSGTVVVGSLNPIDGVTPTTYVPSSL